MNDQLKAAADFVQRSGVLARTDIIPALNAEMNRVDASFDKILATLAANRTLAAKVIAVANSAWFASRIKVDSVEVAFARLGMKDFYSVALAAALRHGLGESPEANKTWAHLEMIARTCEILAQQFSDTLIEPGFATGLLHDCGVPLMVKDVTDFGYFFDQTLGFDSSINEMEEECYQFNHAQVGAVLVEAWQFPASCARAIEFHHRTSLQCAPEGEARQLLALLVLAERVAAICSGEIAAAFNAERDAALAGEIADALNSNSAKVNHAIEEAVRLYSLRVAHS